MTQISDPQPPVVVLAGFMGSGKTAVGRALADRLGVELIDTDELIEASTGMTMPEVFERKGEKKFRELETNICRGLSPTGGTVVATELMHDEVKRFRKSTGKPVVAVTMDVAASGGYYIACACDEIVAQPSSVLGSIGVIMQMFDVSGTMHKIGVKSEAVVSGPRKDAGSPFRTMTPEERALFQGIVNDMYGRFVDAVADGRPDLDRDEVRSIADGRVYTARQALELGLIDRIATLRDTIAAVKRQVGTEKIRLVAYRRQFDYRPNYYAQAPHRGPTAVNLLNVNVSDWMGNTTPRFMYIWSP